MNPTIQESEYRMQAKAYDEGFLAGKTYVLAEMEGWLVDEEVRGVYLDGERLTADHQDHINHAIAIRNNYRKELRAKLEEMGGEE